MEYCEIAFKAWVRMLKYDVPELADEFYSTLNGVDHVGHIWFKKYKLYF